MIILRVDLSTCYIAWVSDYQTTERFSFFCKTIYSFHKMGHKKIQKTNHYILLTNVSIKRCIKTSFETWFIRGGGKSSNQTSTLQTKYYI